MSVAITIAGTTYNFPQSGEDPNWGAEATDTILALAEAINTLLAPGDILTTTFAIANNVNVAANINGLLFDSGTVRAANINYTVYRTSDTTPSGTTKSGILLINFDDSAPVGSKWSLTDIGNGNSGLVFGITDAGQLTYTSNDIGNVGYSGLIVFNAKTLPKA